MNDETAIKISNKIFDAIFEKNNRYNIETLFEKYAFDIKLPKKVKDSTTNEITWSDSNNSKKYITNTNMEKKDNQEGWMLKKQKITNLQDLLNIWNKINLTTTERVYDSENTIKSDTIYRCENIYQCTNCNDSKYLIYSNSCSNCEYLIASQRSINCCFCIRTNDSINCSNSYNVICSNKIINSLFIQDCNNLHECIFCSHISSKRYCIANMQFEKEEYYNIKESIITWILNQ